MLYTRLDLFSVRQSVTPTLGDDVIERVRQLGLRHHRGRRAGRSVKARTCRPVAVFRPVGNGAYIVSRRHLSIRRRVYRCTPRRDVVQVPIIVQRHTRSLGRGLVFGSMNVQSLSPSKLDNLLLELRDRSIDVLLLCETWHDDDSVSIRRLRADGFRVVQRARPRSRRAEAQLTVNHGGVIIAAVPSLPDKIQRAVKWLCIVCVCNFNHFAVRCLQCFDTVGWVAGRASGL